MYFLSIKNYLLNSHLYTIRKWPFLMGKKTFTYVYYVYNVHLINTYINEGDY